MIKAIQQFFDKLKNLVLTEVEIIKLKAFKALTTAVANAYAALSLIIFLNTTLILCGVWFGFYMSRLLDSFHAGFGIAAAVFILLLIILAVFHQQIMVKPFQNLMIRALKGDEDKKPAKKAPSGPPAPQAQPAAKETTTPPKQKPGHEKS